MLLISSVLVETQCIFKKYNYESYKLSGPIHLPFYIQYYITNVFSVLLAMNL